MTTRSNLNYSVEAESSASEELPVQMAATSSSTTVPVSVPEVNIFTDTLRTEICLTQGMLQSILPYLVPQFLKL